MTRKKWIAVAVTVLVIAAAMAVTLKRPGQNNQSFRKIVLLKGDLQLSVMSTGTVQPENRVEIKAPISGRVERVVVEEGQAVRRGQILAQMSSTERAALLDAARSKGGDEVKKWEELYRPTPILAPISGRIIQRNVESGQSFGSTDAIFVMSDRLTVKAQVDETDISQIVKGQQALITLDAYPNDKIPAKVDQIAYDAKTINNVTTYLVDVLPDETPTFMRSGMTANVQFKTAARAGVLLVPNEAIRVKGESRFVRVSDDLRQPEVEIEVGLSDGKQSEVKSGLSEGATVYAPLLKISKDGRSDSSSPFSPIRPRRAGGARGQ